jgi:hypothetical protein
VLLLVLNVLVLLGQVLPAGAPPFVRAVNIAFRVLNLASFSQRTAPQSGAAAGQRPVSSRPD